MVLQQAVHKHVIQPHRINLVALVRHDKIGQCTAAHYDTIANRGDGAVGASDCRHGMVLHGEGCFQRMCHVDIGERVSCGRAVVVKFLGDILAVHPYRGNFIARFRRDGNNRIRAAREMQITCSRESSVLTGGQLQRKVKLLEGHIHHIVLLNLRKVEPQRVTEAAVRTREAAHNRLRILAVHRNRCHIVAIVRDDFEG